MADVIFTPELDGILYDTIINFIVTCIPVDSVAREDSNGV